MNNRNVVVLDYGMGNVLSVCRAVEHCGSIAQLIAKPAAVAAADRLVLPGVGSFGDCMAALCQRNLIDPIRCFVATGRPFLGICVGMQILLDHGEEFAGAAGLGLIGGRVVQIGIKRTDKRPRKLPHIGWSGVALPSGADANLWARTILCGTNPNTPFYFVHSFTAEPADPSHVLAISNYEEFTVTAAVRRDNITGTQFHPEKSGEAGLRVLSQFCNS